ncbi:MAG: AAA family ATPase [Bacteroidia bacterium]
MHSRELFQSLSNHLPNRQITVITGMRRVGKTTALKYLLQKAPGDNKLYMNLERVKYRQLLRQSSLQRG